MPLKTKTKKKPTKSKTTSANKRSAKTKPKKKIAVKSKISKTKPRPARKKVVAKPRGKPKRRIRKKSQSPKPVAFSVKGPRTRSGRQSGDLQGLSRKEGADSESVAELLEEGNTFEADIVLGVEGADDDAGEVRTHEVPEDDVPGEYLDED